MYEAVEDGIGQGWFPDGFMPVLNRQLGSDHRRARVVAIVEYLQKVAAVGVVQGCDEPIVQNDEVHVIECRELVSVGAIGPGDVEVVEQSLAP